MKIEIFLFGLFLCTKASILLNTKIQEDHISQIFKRYKRQAELGVKTTYFDKNPGIIQGRSSSIEKYILRKVREGAPPTPQKIRLRSDVSSNPNEGRLEVYNEESKRWGLVCDDYWTLPNANVTCRQLGFQRAAREALRHDSNGMGNWEKNDFVIDRIKCQGNEKNLFQCSHIKTSHCSGGSAGVTCIYNTGCPYGWLSFDGACYQVNITPLNFLEASKHCESESAKLTFILTTNENNFLSNVLYTSFKKVTKIWTGGYYAQITYDNGKSEYRWNWYSTIHDVNHWNTSHLWFPGYDEIQSDKRPQEDQRTKSCLALSRIFADSKKSKKIYDVNYFWWDNLSCMTKLPFICEKLISRGRSDCYDDIGTGYRGTTSRTNQGSSCQKWTHPTAPVNPNSHPNSGLGDHNFCRNPDNDVMPWCYTNSDLGIYGYCAIGKCADIPYSSSTLTPIEKGFGKGQCDTDQYFCPSMSQYSRQCLPKTKLCDKTADCIGKEDESPDFCYTFLCKPGEFYCAANTFCISQSHVCDGIRNCADGADEKNCTQIDESFVLNRFRKFESKILVSDDKISFMGISLTTCMEKCKILYPQFPCRSFNYIPKNETGLFSKCDLMKIISENSEKLTSISFPGAYYSLKTDCTGKFQCSSGMCLLNSKKCNGINDCGDSSDEKDCPSVTVPPFEIRLTGSNNDWEGKIEIRYEGEWGYVCDDKLNIYTARVICVQLGFLDAIEAVQGAGTRFGRVRHPNILLDEVNCNGTEFSIEDCPHDPWRKHNCKSEEIGGVVCKVDRACVMSEYRCTKDKLCIKLTQVCDGKKDCSDGSDEPEGKCSLQIKLINGLDGNSGRVEVVGPYSRGTICGDMFDDKDATVICKMLGIPGRAEAVKDNRFGEGSGEIAFYNLECNGNEENILNCSSKKWGDRRCSHKNDVGVICGLQNIKETITSTTASVTNKYQIPGVSCGKRPIIQKRSSVLGGFETKYGAFPWQVGLRRKENDYDFHWCGGSILSEDWIITASHCFTFPKEDYNVVTGDWNNNEPDTYQQVFQIEELYLNPDYKGIPSFDYDLTLIKIKRNDGVGIIFNNYVQPVCLPKPGMVPDVRTKCLVSGWGDTLIESTEVLLAAEVPLVKAERCMEFYKNRITPRMQCAGYEAGGIDTCQGDSGGPLVCRVDGIYTIFGATSWGEGCGLPKTPGVYAKIDSMLDWVYQVTGFNKH